MEAKWVILGGLAAVILVIVLLVVAYFAMYNGLIVADQKVSAQWGQVEVQYQRRVDLIPNIVAVVSQEANFEKSTLTELTALRSQWQTASSEEAKVQTANEIEATISKLLLITENYPTLTATQGYQDLIVELEGTENRVAFARGEYNSAIQEYNVKVRTFPSLIVANMNNFKVKEYFSAKSGAEDAPNVNELFN